MELSFGPVPDGYTVASAAWAQAWAPKKLRTVSEWAQDNRKLSPKSSAEPGDWDNARIPYLVGVMDALSDSHPAQEVIFKKSSQVGATECGLNWIGWTIEDSPAPMLTLFPTEKLGMRWSRTRLQPMLDDTPSIQAIIPSGRKQDNSNTITEKDFPGGHLFIGSANIPTDLASTPVQRLFLDESDRFPLELENEGDPVALVVRRTATWNTRRKIFENSSPIIESLSRINKSYNRSSQGEYYVPCPHCGEFQTLKWAQLRYPEGERPVRHAYYVCAANGCVIDEHHKTEMLARGEWRHAFPERCETVIGFHISCLYTPEGLGDNWAQNAEEYEKAKGDPSMVKVFQNTRLGLTFKDPREKIDWVDVWNRRETYALREPQDGVLLLTCGIDVQADRLAIMVGGWGRRERFWVVDYFEQPGDPTRGEIWAWLDDFLAKEIVHVSGAPMLIKATAIDSGFLQHDVIHYTRDRKHRNIFATKGAANLSKQVIGRPTLVDVKWNGQMMRRGGEQFPLGVGNAKLVLHNRLRADAGENAEGRAPVPLSIEERHLHFPEALGQDFFRAVCAEVFDPNTGKWITVVRRNEPLDCIVLNFGAAMHPAAQVQRMREEDWDKLEGGLRARSGTKPAEGLTLTHGFMPVPAKVRR